MSYIESILFGILQALTEFFPVSSSAHLKLLQHFLGVGNPENGVLLELSCHLGSLGALCLFLHRELRNLFLKEQRRLLWFFLAMLPLVPMYFLLKPLKEILSTPHFLGFFLLGSGLILLAGQFLSVPRSENRGLVKQIRDVLVIGTMQSAALIPGISRSASTISCARILGWTPQEAVRFSFLLSIPTILGGNLWEFAHIPKSIEVPLSSLSLAFLSSFLVSFLVVRKAIGWLEKGNLKPFAWYCFALGAFTIWYFNF